MKKICKRTVALGIIGSIVLGQNLSVMAATYTVSTPGFSRTSVNDGLAYKRVVSGTTSTTDGTYMKTEVWCIYHVTGTSTALETPGTVGYGTSVATTTETTTYGTAYIFDYAKNEGSYRNSNYSYVSVGVKTKSIK